MLLWLEGMLWSGPLLGALLGSHVYFTWKLRGVQRHTLRGIRWSLEGEPGENGVSGFGALSTALAAAIGTGNIIGVATAVALGGPGAVFWCWLTGVLGMATRYAETVLVLRHRRQGPEGPRGGARYLLEAGGHPVPAGCFAVFGVLAALGTGSMIQSHAIRTAIGLPPLPAGVLVAALAAPVILGGGRSIARVCRVLVPVMAGVYLLGCGMVLWHNREALPETVRLILAAAFLPRSAGGGFVGSTVMTAARYGVARGLFTNEAGMGTAPMATAAAPCRDPVRASLSAMTAVFWDTVVICAVTGLVIVSSVVRRPAVFAGAPAEKLCLLAFEAVPCGPALLRISLCAFAFATVVGWCWYGESCWRYLGREPGAYRAAYLGAAVLGAFGELEAVWSLGSILAGLMALPNLYALFALRHQAAEGLSDIKIT